MSLKNKTICTLLVALIIILLSYSMWKKSESDAYRKRIYSLEGQLLESDNNRIARVKLYAPVYIHYLNNKSYIREKTGSKSSILIYRFSKNMCDVCVQEDLHEIEQFQKDIGKEKIVLLPDYPDERKGMIELTNVLSSKFNYVNIPIETLLIPANEDSHLHRYFAVIDDDGNLTMLFFPRTGETDLTRLYLSEVKKALQEQM